MSFELYNGCGDAGVPQIRFIFEANARAAARSTFITTDLNYAHPHQQIVERCRSGDRQAQFDLYRLYSKAMYNVCLRMLNDNQHAEDLLQVSFCDVFTKLHSFRSESSIGSWIKRITVNNCINFLKKRRLQISDDELALQHAPAATLHDEVDDCRYDVACINRCIHRLPDGYRVVFSLYLLEGYDHGEIAEVLGISEATSKSQFSRAKAKMRDLLREEMAV